MPSISFEDEHDFIIFFNEILSNNEEMITEHGLKELALSLIPLAKKFNMWIEYRPFEIKPNNRR